MTIRTIQTQAQADTLTERWPNAYSNRPRSDGSRAWCIGFTADWNSEAAAILDRICPPGPARRKALKRWWEVESVNLPG